MTDSELKYVLEALLISSQTPLSIEQLMSAFEEWQRPSEAEMHLALEALKEDYALRAFEITRVASGYCLQTKASYGAFIGRMQAEKPSRYSRALLETLAIIAYKQPVTRADIEEIRGVNVSSSMLKTLQEREWIKMVGFKDVPGKPAVYCTTKAFLDYFNLRTLSELPPLRPITADKIKEE